MDETNPTQHDANLSNDYLHNEAFPDIDYRNSNVLIGALVATLGMKCHWTADERIRRAMFLLEAHEVLNGHKGLDIYFDEYRERMGAMQ